MKARVRFSGAEPVCSAIYMCSVSASLMYVIAREQAFLFAAAMSLLSFGVYMLFYVLRRRKGFAALAALAVGAVCLGTLMLVREPRADGTFMDFIYTASDFFDPIYAAAATVIFSAVVGFACCFFSAYSPRPCFLMLVMFIPLILSVRTAGGVPLPLLAFMLAGFVLAAGGMALPEKTSGPDFSEDKRSRFQRLAALGLAALAAAGITVFVPRNENTPMGGYLDTVFSGSTGGYYAAAQQLTNFLTQSSVNRGANSPTGKILFTAAGEVPEYIDRASFDTYSGGVRGWAVLDEFSMGYSGWELSAQSRSMPAFVNKLRDAVSEGRLEKYADILGALPEQDDSRKTAFIQIADGSSTAVILHPEGICGVSPVNYHDSTYMNARGELFTENNMPANEGYRLEYYGGLTDEAAALLSQVDLEELILDARTEDVITFEEYSALRSRINTAEKYRKTTSMQDDIPQKIRDLAEEITAGLTTDYEKARAIGEWFGTAGFVYDMDFVPEKVDAEYFLFNSRRGICSDFATASVLLARAAGLSVKYTEGFLITDELRGENSYVYYVTDAQYHAYAQVYADGAGVIVIDGTKYAAKYDGTDNYIYVWAIAAAAVAILIIIFRKKISELFFRLTYPMRKPDAKLRGVFLRTRAAAGKICGRAPESMTAGETAEVISRSLGLEEQGNYICNAADALFYGGGAQADGKRLMRAYREILARKRRMKK